MTETKHTPGPWGIEGGNGNTDADLFIWKAGDYQGGHGLVQVFAEGAEVHGGTVEANARLIAAAPDLLAALVGLLQAFDNMAMKPPSSSEAYLAARAAIRRATGEV